MMTMKNQINNLKFIPKNHKRRREAAFYAHLHWRSDTGFTGSPSDTGHFLQCVWPLTSLMRLWTVRTSRNTHLGTFKLKRLTLHSGAPHRLVKWSFWVWFEHLPPPLIGSQQWWKTEDAASCSISLEHLHHIKLIPDQFETFTDRQEKRKTLQWCLHSHMSSFISWPEVCGQSSERFLIFTKM